MEVSAHLKRAYSEVVQWLKKAKLEIARLPTESARIPLDLTFASAADKFVAALKLETGEDEVSRRAVELSAAYQQGTAYYAVRAEADAVGLVVEDMLPLAIRLTSKRWQQPTGAFPIRATCGDLLAYKEWRAIQFSMGNDKRHFTDAQIDVMERWSVACDKIVSLSGRQHGAGCRVLITAATLLKYAKPKPPTIGLDGIRSTGKAVLALKRWIIGHKRRPALTKKQSDALAFIRARGPIKGAVIARHIHVHDSTFRTHYLPVLRQHQVRNDGSGYYVAGD